MIVFQLFPFVLDVTYIFLMQNIKAIIKKGLAKTYIPWSVLHHLVKSSRYINRAASGINAMNIRNNTRHIHKIMIAFIIFIALNSCPLASNIALFTLNVIYK